MLPDLLLEPLVRAALVEDLGPTGDATCRAVIPHGLTYAARLNARAAGRLQGAARERKQEQARGKTG